MIRWSACCSPGQRSYPRKAASTRCGVWPGQTPPISTLDGGYLTLFAQHVHALAYYRAGRWAEAIAKARESEHDWPDWAAQPMNWCVQAMASFRMGKTAEARTWLDRVEASIARPAHASAKPV